MPIDHIVQTGGTQVRPVETPRSTPTVAAAERAAAARQALPGGGEDMPPVAARPADAATVSQVVSRLNDYVQTLRRDLVFRVDKETDKVVVTVVDPETGEVIRQIPSEEVMAVARALGQLEQGLLFDAKA